MIQAHTVMGRYIKRVKQIGFKRSPNAIHSIPALLLLLLYRINCQWVQQATAEYTGSKIYSKDHFSLIISKNVRPVCAIHSLYFPLQL
jgi:hypothetical protein